MDTRLLAGDDPARTRAEQMVRTVYRETYGASIDGFPPLMAAVLDEHGRALCAAGLRDAAIGFFSECYLDVPVETGIAAAAREPVTRDRVLEVTTLAAVHPGLALDLVAFVIEHGRFRGMRFGIFTATAPLRRALARAGLELHALAPATAARVARPRQWGCYYRTRPWVCAVADPLRERALAALPRWCEAAAVA